MALKMKRFLQNSFKSELVNWFPYDSDKSVLRTFTNPQALAVQEWSLKLPAKGFINQN